MFLTTGRYMRLACDPVVKSIVRDRRFVNKITVTSGDVTGGHYSFNKLIVTSGDVTHEN